MLVIKGGKFRRDRLTVAIYRTLRGKDAAVDVVVVTPEKLSVIETGPGKGVKLNIHLLLPSPFPFFYDGEGTI